MSYLAGLSLPLLLLLKATLAIGIAWIAILLLERAASASRHAVLAFLFAFLLLLPAAVVLLPARTLAIAGPPVAAATMTDLSSTTTFQGGEPASSAGAGIESSTGISLISVAGLLYGTGVLMLLIRWSVAMFRLRTARRAGTVWVRQLARLGDLAQRAGVRRPVNLVLSDDVTTPLTYGVIHPVIMLPGDAAQWEAGDLQRALTHELEHIRRADWLTQLVARLVCTIYWVHPFAWLAARRLVLEAERACDDAVLLSAVPPEGYAEQLVTLARRMREREGSGALAMAGKSLLFARVRSILNGAQRRGPVRPAVLGAGALITFLAVLIIAPLQAIHAGQRSIAASESSDVLAEALLEAAARGDRATIARLLEIGVSVDTVVIGDGTPLIQASRNGHREVSEYLLARGADVDLAVRGDGNPIIVAAAAGHLDIVRMLLDRGADINANLPSDENALIQASWNGHLAIVELLLSRGADVNAQIGPRTALRMARREGHSAIVSRLLSAGATR